jgi:hypothetical protein
MNMIMKRGFLSTDSVEEMVSARLIIHHSANEQSKERKIINIRHPQAHRRPCASKAIREIAAVCDSHQIDVGENRLNEYAFG